MADRRHHRPLRGDLLDWAITVARDDVVQRITDETLDIARRLSADLRKCQDENAALRTELERYGYETDA